MAGQLSLTNVSEAQAWISTRLAIVSSNLSLAHEAFGKLDTRALGIEHVGDLEATQGGHGAPGEVDSHAGRLEFLADGFNILDLESDVIEGAALGGRLGSVSLGEIGFTAGEHGCREDAAGAFGRAEHLDVPRPLALLIGR